MLQEKILEKIQSYLLQEKEFSDLDFTKLNLSVPKNINHGDFSTNFALLNSSTLRSKPLELAEKMRKVIESNKDDFFDKITIEKPGFINFVISNKTYQSFLKEVSSLGSGFGSMQNNGTKVLLEFVSANPTGFLHLGHLRNAAVGDSISRILSFTGYNVTKEYYLNDYGNQIALLGESLKARVFEKLGIDNQIPEGGYKGDYLIEIAELLVSKMGKESLLGEDLLFFSSFAVDYLREQIEIDLKELNIEFDTWFSERKQIHESKYIAEIYNLLSSLNGSYSKDGASWIKTSEFGDNDDWVIKKSDNSSTYFMNDIAYHHNKFNRDYKVILNIWGADHHSHISRLKASMRLLSNDLDKLQFVLIQFVRLVKDGEDVSMSKRSGTYITIKDMLEEFNGDLVRFLMVSRSSDSHFDFDLDKCREGSDENPIYYIQYANARINSILKKYNSESFDIENVDLSLLNSEKEIALIKKILDFPVVVREASSSLAPHKIAFYLQELASIFHGYYKITKVLVEDQSVSSARISLLYSLRVVFANGLNLLGVSSPDRM